MLTAFTAWRSARLAMVLATAAVGLTTLYTPSIAATTVVPITVEQLTQRSDIVVVARVGARRSHWLGRTIVTDVELTINHSLKGSLIAGAHLTLRLPGGDVGNISQVLHGAPSVEENETIVAFLRRPPEANLPVFYLTHLTASILRTSVPAGATSVLVQPAHEGMTLSSTGPTSPRTLMTRAGVSLEQLVNLVRTTQ